MVWETIDAQKMFEIVRASRGNRSSTTISAQNVETVLSELQSGGDNHRLSSS